MDHLVPPANLAGRRVDRDHRRREEVQARPAARPRRRVPGREVDRVRLRVDRRRVPDGRASCREPERAGRPGLAADLTRGRSREEPERRAAVARVVGGDAAAAHVLAARRADIDERLLRAVGGCRAVVVQRGGGEREALSPVVDDDLPHHAARHLVEGDERPVELRDEDLPVTDRDAAVVPSAAGGVDRLFDPRVIRPDALPRRGVHREDVAVAGGEVHHAVVDDRSALGRILRSLAGAVEMDVPRLLELGDVGRVDLVERRISGVRYVAPVRDPVRSRPRGQVGGRECWSDGVRLGTRRCRRWSVCSPTSRAASPIRRPRAIGPPHSPEELPVSVPCFLLGRDAENRCASIHP